MRGARQEVTLCILIDALRYDYITKDNTPFLWSVSEQGEIGSLYAPFGFTGDSCWFAGQYPQDSDEGMMFQYCPATSPFKFARYIPNFLGKVPLVERIIRRGIGEYIRRSSKFKRLREGNALFIPRCDFSFLPFWDYTYKIVPWDERYPLTSVFDLLRSQGMSWYYHGHPQYKCNLETVRERFFREQPADYPFVFLFISDLDDLGHTFGPNSDQVREKLGEIDRFAEEAYSLLKKSVNVINLLVFGDHGMVEVEREFDMAGYLKKTKAIVGKHYLYFLDSTIARFWFFNPGAEEEITGVLAEIGHGTLITEDRFEEFKIDYGHNRFGELFWVCEGGEIILPNYFQGKKRVKGMHGYLPAVRDNHSALVLKRGKTSSSQVAEGFPTPSAASLRDRVGGKTSSSQMAGGAQPLVNVFSMLSSLLGVSSAGD